MRTHIGNLIWIATLFLSNSVGAVQPQPFLNLGEQN